MRRLVLDASVVLKAFFPDEEGHAQAQALVGDWVRGDVELVAPPLLPLEVTNAVLVALRQRRLSTSKAEEILQAVQDLCVPVQETPEMTTVLRLALKYSVSAYDATYIALAREPFALVTGDRALANALKGQALWIEDYE